MQEFYASNNDLYRGKDFLKVKAAVKNNLMQQKVQQLYAQATEELAELSYTNPNSLHVLAQTYTLPIQSTELFTREGGMRNTLTADPKIINAAFSDEVLLHRNNSAPIPLDQTTMIVLRIKQVQPASVRSFAEVRETIQHLLTTELAQKQAKELSEQVASDLQNTKLSPEEIARRYQKQWNKKAHINRHANEVPAPILKHAFEMPAPREHHSSFAGLPLDQNNVVLIAVDAVYPGQSTASPQESEKMRQKLEHDYAEAEYEFYVKSKIAKAKIVMSLSQQK
jgi:peptidyl-prolyl cis-trans isomerase D